MQGFIYRVISNYWYKCDNQSRLFAAVDNSMVAWRKFNVFVEPRDDFSSFQEINKNIAYAPLASIFDEKGKSRSMYDAVFGIDCAIGVRYFGDSRCGCCAENSYIYFSAVRKCQRGWERKKAKRRDRASVCPAAPPGGWSSSLWVGWRWLISVWWICMRERAREGVREKHWLQGGGFRGTRNSAAYPPLRRSLCMDLLYI